MSRIAKYPVVLPKGVEVSLGAGEITVKGPLGSLTQVLHPSVAIAKEGEQIQVSAVAGAENAKALSGTVRALVNNMVVGCHQGLRAQAECWLAWATAPSAG
jgi:large subunit ribosomal protein L6